MSLRRDDKSKRMKEADRPRETCEPDPPRIPIPLPQERNTLQEAKQEEGSESHDMLSAPQPAK